MPGGEETSTWQTWSVRLMPNAMLLLMISTQTPVCGLCCYITSDVAWGQTCKCIVVKEFRVLSGITTVTEHWTAPRVKIVNFIIWYVFHEKASSFCHLSRHNLLVLSFWYLSLLQKRYWRYIWRVDMMQIWRVWFYNLYVSFFHRKL